MKVNVLLVLLKEEVDRTLIYILVNVTLFSGMRPGPVMNIQYTGRGVYYYENKNNPEQSAFMAVLKWDPPEGKNDSGLMFLWTKNLLRLKPFKYYF